MYTEEQKNELANLLQSKSKEELIDFLVRECERANMYEKLYYIANEQLKTNLGIKNDWWR